MARRRRRYDPRKDERRRKDQAQRQDQIIARAPKHVTVFGITLVFDISFAFEPLVVLVSNIFDRNPDGSKKIDGKKAGIGCPGGGLELLEEFQNPNLGLRRETLEETGLWLRLCSIFRYSHEVGKIIWTGKGKRLGQKKTDTFEYGKQPRLERDPKFWEVECWNPVFFSVALPDWEGTPHQQIFRELARRKTAEDIRYKGLFYDFTYAGEDKLDITPEKLGITAEGRDEIDGIYLLPLTRIREWFAEAPKVSGMRGYAYYNHFKTISEHAEALKTWYSWLQSCLLEEAERITQAARFDDKLVEPLRQAIKLLPEGYYNVPAISAAISDFCQHTETPNPVERYHYRDWLKAIVVDYQKENPVPNHLIDVDDVMRFHKRQLAT